MATYLLLRNNKESGPYSLDDLMNLGLKAYDLVWIQGKSAAWRYPSEVEELKSFAPVVEEQPFDRFFKKQPDTRKESIKEEKPVSVIAPEHEKYIPKKSVFVTMPGQKNGFTPQPKKAEPTPAPEPVSQTIIVSENPAAAQIKYSQPLDEIKEMYVKTLYDRKQKIARKSFWLQNLKKVAIVLLFVAVGLIAGFLIKSNGNKQTEIAQKTSASATPAQSIKTETPATIPATDSNTNSPVQPEPQVLHQPTGGYINKEPQQKQESLELKQTTDKLLLSDTKRDKQISSSQSESTNSFMPQNVDVDPATGERRSKMRDANSPTTTINNKNEPKTSSLGELGELVSVSSNEYKKVAFGGIRDLQLTITNDSKYVLDNVTVELQYIKPNELPLRTENIQFKSVAPKATSTVRVPDTNRGIKVVYRIVNIKSRQMDEVARGN